MIIMVTGGRDFLDLKRVKTALEPYAEMGNVLLTGGAKGADQIAEQVWRGTFQLPYIGNPAMWNAMGRPAGQVRNLDMIRGTTLAPNISGLFVPDVVIAFPGGRGTAGARKAAEAASIKVVDG